MRCRILEGAENMRLDDIVRLLRTTYWAGQRPTEKLAGFARVISDHATTYYLCDVIVDEAYRGKGLGKALLAHVTEKYAGLRGLLLTRDAHGLYAKFGFETVNGRAMVK